MNWYLLAMSYLGLFWLGMIESGRGPVYPDILKEWSLSTAQGAWFFTLASVAGLLVTLLARIWLPKFGVWNSFRISTFLGVLGCFGMGYGARFGFAGVLVFAFVFGLSVGGLGTGVNLLAIRASTEARRTQVMSGLHSCFGLASLLAPQILIYFSELGWDWKTSFQIMALGPLSLFLMTFLQKQDSGESLASPSFSAPAKLRWYLGLMVAIYVGAELALATRLALFLRTEFQFNFVQSSRWVTYFYAMLMAGRLFLTWVRLPIANTKMLVGALVLSLVSSFLGLYFHPFFLVLTGLTMSVFFPCAVSVFSEKHPEWSDEIVATLMSGIGIVLITVHWGVGQLAALSSVKIALLTCPILLLISLVMLLFWLRGRVLAKTL